MEENKNENVPLGTNQSNEPQTNEIPSVGNVQAEPVTPIVNDIETEIPVAETTTEAIIPPFGENNLEKEKKGNKKVVLIVISILVLLALIAGAIIYFLNKPKVLFFNSVNKTYNQIIEELTDYKSDSLKDYKNKAVNSTFSLKANLQTKNPEYKELADFINKLSIDMKSDVDYKNKEFAYNIDLKSNNNTLINSSFYGTKQNMYIELKDLFSKYIKIDMSENYDEVFTEDMNKDLKLIVETVKDTYLKQLDNKDFTKTKEEIDINGKKVKTTKLSLNLDSKRFKEINEGAIDELLLDDEFIKAVSNYADLDEKDVKESLEDAKKTTFDDEELVINTYLNKKDSIKYEMIVKSDSEDLVVSGIDYDDYFDLTVKEGDSILASLTKEDDKIFVKLGTMTMEINKESDNKYNIFIKSGSDEITGTLVTTEKEISKTEESGTFTLTLYFDRITKLTVSGKSNIKIVDKIEIPDLKNNVDANDLTEEDYNTIMTKLMQNPGIVNLFGADISSAFTTSSNNMAAAEDSFYGAIRSAELGWAKSLQENPTLGEVTCTFTNAKTTCTDTTITANFSGKLPTSGTIKIGKDGRAIVTKDKPLVINGQSCYGNSASAICN